MPRYIDPVPQYLLTDGDPSPAGKLYFFESGTNTPLTTYADVNETIANPHPVILNGDGSTPNIFFSEAAKVKRTDSDDVQLWERDPVVTATTTSALGGTWDAITVYNIGDIAEVNNVLYISITNNNQNNNPVTTATAWTEFDLLKRWNINETYKIGDPVTGSDGLVYSSSINSNIGNDPITSDDSIWKTNKSNVKNLLIGNFRVNQREVSGTVVLAAGIYGHDRFRGGSSGCTYTFATSANVTTITISAGTLEQEIEGSNIQSGTHVLGWEGTSQARIDGGSYGDTGITATLTGGTNAIIEFDDGTISQPRLREGSRDTGVDERHIGDELSLCQRYYVRSQLGGKASAAQDTPHMVAGSTTLLVGWIVFPSVMRTTPTCTVYASVDLSDGRVETVANVLVTGNITVDGARDTGIGQLTNDTASFLLGSSYQFQWIADAEL
jgi:hypothetical protein